MTIMVDETTGPNAASNPNPNTGSSPAAPTGASQNTSLDAPVPALGNTAGGESRIKDDISKILKEIKLPERREGELAGERVPRKAVRDIDSLLAADAATGRPVVEPGATPAAQPAPEKTDAIQSLHTLKQDLQHVVQDQKISLVRAVALEEDRGRTPDQARFEPARTSRTKNFVLGAILLLFLGGAALAGVYIVVEGRSKPLTEQPENSLVFAEQTVALGLDEHSAYQLKDVLAQARNASSASLGSITRVAPTVNVPATESTEANVRLATLPEFLSALDAKPPDELLRALSTEFFFGYHTVDKNAPLIVISVLSYDRAFKGMLTWEQGVNAELAPIFSAVPALTVGTDGLPVKRTFSDVVMRNYDVRALKDDAGTVQLYYSFPTRDLLVIAESPYTFTEVLSRLQAQRKL